VQREKYRLIFQGGRNKEPFDRARLKSGPKQRKKNCIEEKRKQGSSKTLRYKKVEVEKTGSLLVLT
jgi:hypothetical protein